MYLDENRSYERDFPPDEILVAASLFKLERDRGARDITVLSFFQAISCFSLFQPQISHSQNKKKNSDSCCCFCYCEEHCFLKVNY